MQSLFYDIITDLVKFLSQSFLVSFQSKSQRLVKICWFVPMNCGDCFLASAVMQLIHIKVLLVYVMHCIRFLRRKPPCMKMFQRHYRSHFINWWWPLYWCLYLFVFAIDFACKCSFICRCL